MKPIRCKLIGSTAAVCLLMVTGMAIAQDGIVRISDNASRGDAGVVRISDHKGAPIRQISYDATGCTTQPACGESGCCNTVMDPSCVVPGGCSPGCCPSFGNPMCGACSPNGMCCQSNGMCCQSGGCLCGNCGCNPCHCAANNMCNNCQGFSFGNGHCQNMNTLFAGCAPVCSNIPGHSFFRGQTLSFQAKNARLADKLFGWMVPSGNCGQGLPPVGKYHTTYADQPDYFDPRDGQLYAAQGYGMPMTVPMAPNVQHAYNYSWGVPASRVTPLSNFNPQTSPQRMYFQTW